MRVLVVGSLHFEGSDRVRSDFERACRLIGAALGRRRHELVAGSQRPSTADRYVIEGLASVPGGPHRVFVYRPDDGQEFDADRLSTNLVVSVQRAGTTWLTGRSSQIRASDVVLVIAGGPSSLETTYAAPMLHKPMVVITSFGGAAATFAKSMRDRPSSVDPNEQVVVVDGSITDSRAEEVVSELERLVKRASAAAEAEEARIAPRAAVDNLDRQSSPTALPPHHPQVREPLVRFLTDTEKGCQTYERNVFIMMPFSETGCLASIEATIREALKRNGFVGHRADDRMYPTDNSLWNNVCTYMYGCKYGIAVLENVVVQEFNPNVALEYGFMRALDKQCLLLKDQRFKPRADITGTLAYEFDILDPEVGVRSGVQRWIDDLVR